MGQRYGNPSVKTNDCQFRLVTLVKRQIDNKVLSFQAVSVDNDMETLRFFQENVQEVIHNVKMVKQLEARDQLGLTEKSQDVKASCKNIRQKNDCARLK